MSFSLLVVTLISLLTALVVTPFIIKLAFKIGATDKPNYRKVHQKIMPRIGGVAIFIGCTVGFLASGVENEKMPTILIGALIIVVLGIFDDKFELSAKIKFVIQLTVASIVTASGLLIEFINIPTYGVVEFGLWSYPLTIFWIVAVTNAINLIDGLDGLATGISVISISTIAVLAAMSGNTLVLTLSLILIGSCLGFLYFNFNPAKIFLGDTGALFLGYSISILSLLGLFKSATLFSIIVPIIILGVPVFDTTFAIIRRIINKKPIYEPDKGHLHHRLLSLGFSHRNTVLVIYGMSVMFSFIAIMFSRTTLLGSIILLFSFLILLEIIAEIVGLVNVRYRPFISFYRKVFGRIKV
ncbi:UDP-GlcNAc:undecaprenyl-phosphate GlcNAc-1-phosphate transferase [Mesobacillus persicus]|uniref:UDP-GlcNAc:undecaprenyl-phosphate GlcNAc-1-phosphate transferase n=1 Tax=Mesobacillus persicus TaxID=930146 RepID=A0A1H8A5D0_9BACI|nr:MraY family glycosyltransferase [Mesobacillus persicus]SEM66112.1 UDP-GlcNAc:undecaprenyl-phosphate GlcNAc-1-phosphate transferase [Mesobacillus persicus]